MNNTVRVMVLAGLAINLSTACGKPTTAAAPEAADHSTWILWQRVLLPNEHVSGSWKPIDSYVGRQTCLDAERRIVKDQTDFTLARIQEAQAAGRDINDAAVQEQIKAAYTEWAKKKGYMVDTSCWPPGTTPTS